MYPAPMLRLLRWLLSRPWIARLSPAAAVFNPWSPALQRDPYAVYRALRDRGAVQRTLGAWVVSRYEDVAFVLRDPRFSVNRSVLPPFKLMRWAARKSPDFVNIIERSLLVLDPPAHTRVRSLVNKAFTPRRVQALRPRIEAIADELLLAAKPRGEMELIRDFAHPLPVVVIAELLGVPSEDREKFRLWSNDVVQILDPLSAGGIGPAKRAATALGDYFREMLAQRRREPRDDLLSAMLVAEEDGSTLGEAELVPLATLLLAAGHETTSNLIGNAVLALLAHPGERKRLQEDPSLLPSAVDEFLRYDAPVQGTDRVATEDLELHGKRIRKGQVVVALLGSANRDERRFAEPDRFDVGRADNRHLAFGNGVHFCLGAPLARLEAEVAIGALLRHFPHFTGPAEPIPRRSSVVLRGPLAVPLRLA